MRRIALRAACCRSCHACSTERGAPTVLSPPSTTSAGKPLWRARSAYDRQYSSECFAVRNGTMRARGTSCAEIGHQMAEVVFLLRADRAVGEKHERVLARQPPDGVIRVDPRVHAVARRELGARGTQLRGEHRRAGAKRGEKIDGGHRGSNLHYTMHDGDDLADVSRSRWHRHRLKTSSRLRRASDPDRLRTLPGSQRAAPS